jgi:multiple sugar transport system substrate-binding protein
MNFIVKMIVSIMLLVSPVLANDTCQISGSGEINTLTNSYPVLELISKSMKACENDNLKISTKLTTQSKEEIPQALSAASSPYDLAQISNSSIPPLQAAGLIQPMNDLVEKYRAQYNIEDGFLIKFGGDIMAIAFQANAQHLFFRKDLFEKHGIAVPATYKDVLAACEILKNEKSIDFPLGGTYKSGWNLAQEFTNIYLAFGDDFFKAGTAEPIFNSEKGIKTLELMKKLMAYMSPNALALDSTAVMQQFQQGQIAMANLWASRAKKMDDKTESKVVDMIDFAAAPTVMKGGTPATTIWWDGFVLPKNMDGDRDLAFQVIMEGVKESVVKENNDAAIWLRSVYKPDRYSKGTFESAKAGAPSYPMLPQTTLAHAAIGNNIGDFMAGKESAKESLDDAVAAYIKAAKEKGYIK